MATIKNLFQEGQDQLNNPTSTSGSSAVVDSNPTAPVGPDATNAGNSGWTNLSQYLKANEGAGAGIASAVTADGQNNIDSAAGKINAYQQKNATVDKTQADNAAKLGAQIQNDPTKVDAKAYKTATASPYANKTDATAGDGYTDASNAYGKANEGYGNLTSEDWSQRSNAVASTFGKDAGSYSKGQGLLDTFILGGDATGQQGLKTFGDKNKAFFGGDKTVTGADGKKSLQQDASKIGALGTARTGVQGTLDAEKARYDGALTGVNKAITDKRSAVNAGVADHSARDVDGRNAADKYFIRQQYLSSGVDAPESIDPYIKPADNSGYIAKEDLDALNALSGLDGSTQQSSKALASGADWTSVFKNIEDLRLAKQRTDLERQAEIDRRAIAQSNPTTTTRNG